MKHQSKLLLLPLLILPLLPIATLAQEVTPEPVQGEVTRDLPDGIELIVADLPLLGVFEHVLALEDGEVLTVVAYDPTNTVDPILVLMDPSGDIMAKNDNHETDITTLNSGDAVIADIEIEQGGDYTLTVDNVFYAEGQVDVVIVTNSDVEIADLFMDLFIDDETQSLQVQTPQVQLQERPQVRTTGPCAASVDFITARLREAPVATAPQVASLRPGDRLLITGKVRGADNYTWYRLENYLWVRADAVLAAGACSAVPTF